MKPLLYDAFVLREESWMLVSSSVGADVEIDCHRYSLSFQGKAENDVPEPELSARCLPLGVGEREVVKDRAIVSNRFSGGCGGRLYVEVDKRDSK